MIEQYFAKAMEFYNTNTTQVWAFIGGLIVLIIIWRLYKKYEVLKAMKIFEGKDLEERVLEDLNARTMTFGEDVDMDIYYGDFNKVGHAIKRLGLQMPTEESIAISTRGKNKDDMEMEEIEVFVLVPDDKMSKMVWIVLDKWLGISKKSKYLIVKNDGYRSEGDRMVINEDFNFIRRGGVMMQTGKSTENVVNEIVSNETYNNILKSIPDFVEKINYFDSEHSQGLDRMSKLAEIDNKKVQQMIRNQ